MPEEFEIVDEAPELTEPADEQTTLPTIEERLNAFVTTGTLTGNFRYGNVLDTFTVMEPPPLVCSVCNLEVRVPTYVDPKGTNIGEGQWACQGCTNKAMKLLFRILKGNVLND